MIKSNQNKTIKFLFIQCTSGCYFSIRLQHFISALPLLSAVTQRRSHSVEWFQHHQLHSGHIRQVVTSVV